MSAFESIRQGMSEALDYANGKTDGSVVHEVAVPRSMLPKFAPHRVITGGFCQKHWRAKRNLAEREQGRRHPTGPAQVLLALIAKKPGVVQEILR